VLVLRKIDRDRDKDRERGRVGGSEWIICKATPKIKPNKQ